MPVNLVKSDAINVRVKLAYHCGPQDVVLRNQPLVDLAIGCWWVGVRTSQLELISAKFLEYLYCKIDSFYFYKQLAVRDQKRLLSHPPMQFFVAFIPTLISRNVFAVVLFPASRAPSSNRNAKTRATSSMMGASRGLSES